jgi:Cu-processing system ATP-binding protein
MSAILQVTGLRKKFGELTAVDGLSLTVAPGEVVALLGPNGSGKTTTIRCIAGLLNSDAGTISIAGRDLKRHYRESRRHFTYLPQQALFQPQLTVREVARFHSALRGLTPAAAETALAQSGLPATALDRPCGQLSGGMRQRLGLTLCRLGEPDLMLFDEPTANLDPQGALEFRRQAADWRDAGRAILLSTHVLADVESLASRVVVLVDGCPVADEPVSRLRERLSRTARLRVGVVEPREAHVEAALASGASEARLNCKSVLITAPEERRVAIIESFGRLGPVLEFETERPALEDIYIEYIAGRAGGTS